MSIYNQKWQKFLKRIWPSQFIPFVDFVFAAGSLATGDPNKNSDFDVIVGCQQGRIFTTRFGCWLIFGLFGYRRKADHSGHSDVFVVSDRVCFNHFVTSSAYRLSPPYNEYWKKLYLSIVPIYGSKIMIQKFYRANEEWMGKTRLYQEDKRHFYHDQGGFKRLLEYLLSGRFGDWIEKILKEIQIKKIEKNLKRTETHKPRIIYNDDELEFHPHTKRIEDFCRNQE